MDKNLLKILACPKCKNTVVIKGNKILCENCKLKFNFVLNDVPNMLLEDAENY